MSYVFYVTYRYQHGGNDHANASKIMKCSKPYQYKKSPLKSETTQNEYNHCTYNDFSHSRKLFLNPL